MPKTCLTNGHARRADPLIRSLPRPAETQAEPLLVSMREAARRLATSLRTVARLVAEGELPSVKLGRRRLVRVADLAAYVDSLAGVGA